VPENICYIFDDNGGKRDLSLLIHLTDAHAVTTDDDSTMFINVCRDISPGNNGNDIFLIVHV
jgi:hypothetical protein